MNRLLFVLLVAFAVAPLSFAQKTTVLDDFESASAWSAHPSDGVELNLSSDTGLHGKAVRLDFDFHQHGGYAIARRKLDLDLPPNYELTFRMRAEAPVNNLEIKLIDSSGDNVWWLNRRDFVFPKDWKEIVTKKRQITFAWGPRGGGELSQAAAIEIVVTAGTGGKGSVWIDDLALTELPPTSHEVVTRGRWQARDESASLTVDMNGLREIGGLHLKWGADFARDFDVELSREGRTFDTVRQVRANGRRDQLIHLPDEEARFIRLTTQKSSRGRGYALDSLEIEPVDWSPTPNDFFATVASRARRGAYPRYLRGEQPYWTIIGADGADEEALVGEDGNVEPFKGGFSIEPFISTKGKTITWSDVKIVQSLAEGDLPIPSIRWSANGISLTMTAAVTDSSLLLLRYRIKSSAPATLFLAARPFQVNPSTQFLNTVGGISPIHDIAFDGQDLVVNAAQRIHPLTAVSRGMAATWDEGDLPELLLRRDLPSHVTDPTGYATGALAFDIPAGERTIDVTIQLGPTAKEITDSDAELRHIADSWREKLHRVTIRIPGAPEIANTIRTSLAYALIERDGNALEPGSRSYDRAWIRDGSLLGAMLLRLGHADEARAFADWFAGFQFDNGKVPCCVDRRGADPVPENDSHGELIYLVAEVYRQSHDREFLQKMWPHVEAAARYIDLLRSQNHGEFEGLVTESISHEGYSAKPMHSYWDDVFALRGLKDAAFLAKELGNDARARELSIDAASFQIDLAVSIRRVIESKKLDYVPASAELGDFDPTSTAIGISPLGLAAIYPKELLLRTYDEYFARLQKPREDYTPYEMRIIGALVRLGEQERALALIDRFMRDRRPAAWNEWAEVVGTDARKPRFIGDMPHAWVASDFVRSIFDAFVFEGEDGALVVGAGVPRRWIGNGELHVGPIATHRGALDIRMRNGKRSVTIDLDGSQAAAPLVFRPPDTAALRQAFVNGIEIHPETGNIPVSQLPARIVLNY